jgi:hypothetical protein
MREKASSGLVENPVVLDEDNQERGMRREDEEDGTYAGLPVGFASATRRMRAQRRGTSCHHGFFGVDSGSSSAIGDLAPVGGGSKESKGVGRGMVLRVSAGGGVRGRSDWRCRHLPSDVLSPPFPHAYNLGTHLTCWSTSSPRGMRASGFTSLYTLLLWQP